MAGVLYTKTYKGLFEVQVIDRLAPQMGDVLTEDCLEPSEAWWIIPGTETAE